MASSPLCTYLKLFLAGSDILPDSKSARKTPSWLATCMTNVSILLLYYLAADD
jgi:hypothetical protein